MSATTWFAYDKQVEQLDLLYAAWVHIRRAMTVTKQWHRMMLGFGEGQNPCWHWTTFTFLSPQCLFWLVPTPLQRVRAKWFKRAERWSPICQCFDKICCQNKLHQNVVFLCIQLAITNDLYSILMKAIISFLLCWILQCHAKEPKSRIWHCWMGWTDGLVCEPHNIWPLASDILCFVLGKRWPGTLATLLQIVCYWYEAASVNLQGFRASTGYQDFLYHEIPIFTTLQTMMG